MRKFSVRPLPVPFSESCTVHEKPVFFETSLIIGLDPLLIQVHTINNSFLTLVLDLRDTPKFSPQAPKPEPSENAVFQDFDSVACV